MCAGGDARRARGERTTRKRRNHACLNLEPNCRTARRGLLRYCAPGGRKLEVDSRHAHARAQHVSELSAQDHASAEPTSVRGHPQELDRGVHVTRANETRKPLAATCKGAQPSGKPGIGVAALAIDAGLVDRLVAVRGSGQRERERA